jgi:hypothetical protein
MSAILSCIASHATREASLATAEVLIFLAESAIVQTLQEVGTKEDNLFYQVFLKFEKDTNCRLSDIDRIQQ